MRARSSGSASLESPGSTLAGSPASFCSQCAGSSIGRQRRNPASRPSRCAMPSAKRSASSMLGLARLLDRRDQLGVLPDRHAVLAPVQPERPARQAFAGIPFALPVMQQAARREARRAAGGSDRRRAPRLVGPTAAMFHSGDSRSSIETKVGSPPMVRRTSSRFEIGIDLLAERVEPRPGFVGERPGDARRFADALDAHLEAELDIGEAGRCPRSAPPSDNAAWRRPGYGPRRVSMPEVTSNPIQPAPGR